MKTLLIALTCFSTISAQASVYMCRSYNYGNLFIANTETQTIILKDRFGAELDILDHVDSKITNLGLTTEIVFSRDQMDVLTLIDDGQTITGLFDTDDSLQCFVRN